MTPQYDFHYEKIELIKTESLGIGSYGAVCKAMCDGLPCAAKILHPALFQFTTPRTANIARKFEQECHLLSAIKHPHIVQYLGMYRDPESKMPVLLMELMDESLTQFLAKCHEQLHYHTEVNLSHDIALALSYLHSNGIIHRDLSSNNVLLIAGSRVKVTDFGMVKLYGMNHSTAHLTPLTLCPGTKAYMPPEALGKPTMYNEKLDIFSLGVLYVQIMTRQYPDPGDHFQVMEINAPRIRSGLAELDIPEIERRRSHIDLINPAHPLLPLALNCLKNRDRERPSCREICGRISTLKSSPKYLKSVQSHVNIKQTQTTTREREIIHNLQQQLHTKNQLLHKREAAIATCQQEVQQLRQQLQSSEEVTAELQHNLLEMEKTVKDQQKQIEKLQQQPVYARVQKKDDVGASGAGESRGSIRLSWRNGGRAPCKMWGEATAVDRDMAYFSGDPRSKKIYSYDSSRKKWFGLPVCPNYGFSLAMVNTHLTAIGGKLPNHELTNSLYSLIDSKWMLKFPSMPTKRCSTAVVCSGRSLVVAGGTGEGDWDLSAVEVMDTETLQWSTASSLPHPLYQASATLCGGQVYMLGGRNLSGKESRSVFTCSLAALLQSRQPQSLLVQLNTLSLVKPEVWHRLADTPFTSPACASMHGQLLTVGGRNSDDKVIATVCMYNTLANSWEVIGSMATSRCRCLVAVLPRNELITVGGITHNWKTDSIEIFTMI